MIVNQNNGTLPLDRLAQEKTNSGDSDPGLVSLDKNETYRNH